MEHTAPESKLTPAARQVLNTLADEYKNEILLGAEQLAASYTGGVHEISVRDIVDSATRVQGNVANSERNRAVLKTSTFEQFIQLILRTYALLGTVIAILGVVFLLYRGTDIFLDQELRLGVLATFMGVLFALLPYMFNVLRSFVRSSRPETLANVNLSRVFVTKWQEIELAARNLAASQLGESIAQDSVSVLLSFLRSIEVLDLADEVRLRELLSIRNRILHQGAELDQSELELAIKDADKILAKILSNLQGS